MLSEWKTGHPLTHAFLNSCLLYPCLCIKDFHDYQVCILWTLSFMKTGVLQFLLCTQADNALGPVPLPQSSLLLCVEGKAK